MKKLIDKILLSPIWVQLLILVTIIVLAGAVFFAFQQGVSFESETIVKIEELGEKVVNMSNVTNEPNDENNSEWRNKIWYIVGRLIDPGYLGDSNDKVYTLLITIVGWIICGGFLIAIITNAYFERIKKLENGQTRYSFNNHCIIFGCNEMTHNLIEQVYHWDGFDNKSAIIVHSDNDSKDVRAHLKTHIEDKMERNLYVFRGDRGSKEELATLHLEKAGLIIILNERDEPGSDAKNIDCFEIAANIIKQNTSSKQSRIPFYVHFNELPTFQMAKDYNVTNELKDYVTFYPFNFHEQWARKVFVNYAPFFNQEAIYPLLDQEAITSQSNKYVHLFILGYNRMGIALASQAARICHFPSPHKTKITFIDKTAKEHELNFKAQYPGLNTIYDIEFDFVETNVFSDKARNLMVKSCINTRCLSYIAVCFEHPDFSLSVGQNLPVEVYNNGTPVLIRQKAAHSMHKQSYPCIKFFGMLSHNLVLNDITDKLASKANMAYLESQNDDIIKTHTEKEIWENLPSVFKWANRYLVDSYPIKLRSLGLNADCIGKGQASEYISFDTEHRRWMAERVFSGWQLGKNRNDLLKIHHLLVPTDQLEKKEIEKDSILHNRFIKSVINIKSFYGQLPREAIRAETFEKIKGIRAKEIDEVLEIISIENNKLKGKPGEMLCKGIKDELWAMDKNKFLSKYEPDPTEKTDKDGFDAYKPIPEKNRVKALYLTSIHKIKTTEGKTLLGKVGDVLVESSNSSEETPDKWIVDANIFFKTYKKI